MVTTSNATSTPPSGSIQLGTTSVPINAFVSLPTETVATIEIRRLGVEEHRYMPGCVIRKSDFTCRVLARDIPTGSIPALGDTHFVTIASNGVTRTFQCFATKIVQEDIDTSGTAETVYVITFQVQE